MATVGVVITAVGFVILGTTIVWMGIDLIDGNGFDRTKGVYDFITGGNKQ